MKESSIKLDQVTLQFADQETLFHDISFRIDRGEMVALIGPNGSGKTSLAKIIMGLLHPSSGEVHLYEKQVGYVPQYLKKDVFLPMTVEELFSIKLKERSEEYIKEALSVTGVAHLHQRQIRYLSGGEYQRVMIAYALIGKPGLLILDEPVSGIDIHGEQEFFEMLERINKEENTTIIIISHDMDIVFRFASQVICLNKQIVCHGVPSEVLSKDALEATFSGKHGIYHHKHDSHSH